MLHATSLTNRRHNHGLTSSLQSDDKEWVDGLLGGKSKHGVYTADFLDENGTTVAVRDGDTAILDCNVYLRHDKTVSLLLISRTNLFILNYCKLCNCNGQLSSCKKDLHRSIVH